MDDCLFDMDKFTCLSDAEWESYHSGNLSEPEKLKCEEHIASCEICGDMKEGLLLLNKGQVQESLSRIDKAIASKIQPRKAAIEPLWIYSAAAVLLAALAGLLLLVEPKQELAELQNQPQPQLEAIQERPQSDSDIPKQNQGKQKMQNSTIQPKDNPPAVDKQEVVPSTEEATIPTQVEELDAATPTWVESETAAKAPAAVKEDASAAAEGKDETGVGSALEKVAKKVMDKPSSAPTTKGKILPAASNAMQNNQSNQSLEDVNTNSTKQLDTQIIRLHTYKANNAHLQCRTLADSLLQLPGYTYQANRIALLKGLSYLDEGKKDSAFWWLKTFKWEGGKSTREYKLLREAIQK